MIDTLISAFILATLALWGFACDARLRSQSSSPATTLADSAAHEAQSLSSNS